MSRSAKIAGVALAAGVMMATAIAIAVEERKPDAVQPQGPRAPRADDWLREELARCRVLESPDADCEAAWEAHRRQFLGRTNDARSESGR